MTTMMVLMHRGMSIAGGTSEIKRNQIGERILGLPRDPLINYPVRPSARASERRPKVGRVPVHRHEPVGDEPPVTHGDQAVPVPAHVVQADLGEHGEVARHRGLGRGDGLEADVGDVVADDPPGRTRLLFPGRLRRACRAAVPPPKRSMIASRPRAAALPRISRTPSSQNAPANSSSR